jgi:hypothetical protein
MNAEVKTKAFSSSFIVPRSYFIIFMGFVNERVKSDNGLLLDSFCDPSLSSVRMIVYSLKSLHFGGNKRRRLERA